jgi:hypothetical protein
MNVKKSIVGEPRRNGSTPVRIRRRVPPPAESTKLRAARVLGGLSLLVVGGVHLEQYTVAHFSAIPTIGWLFLVNFGAGTAFGSYSLASSVRGVLARVPRLLDALATLAGVGVAAGALAALLISEQTPLFGFMEQGYRLEIVVAIAAEAVAILSLGFVFGRVAIAPPRRVFTLHPTVLDRRREEPT